MNKNTEQSLGLSLKESECRHVGSCDDCSLQKRDAQTDLKCLCFFFSFGLWACCRQLIQNDLGEWRTFFYSSRDGNMLSKLMPSQPQPGENLMTLEIVKLFFSKMNGSKVLFL